MIAWRLSLEGPKNVSAFADLWVGGAISVFTRPDVELTESGLSSLSCNLRRSSVPCAPSQDIPIGSAGAHHSWQDESTASETLNEVPSRRMARMVTARQGQVVLPEPFGAHAVLRAVCPLSGTDRGKQTLVQ